MQFRSSTSGAETPKSKKTALDQLPCPTASKIIKKEKKKAKRRDKQRGEKKKRDIFVYDKREIVDEERRRSRVTDEEVSTRRVKILKGNNARPGPVF